MEAKEIIESELSEKNILDRIIGIFFILGIIIMVIGALILIGNIIIALDDSKNLFSDFLNTFGIGLGIILSGLWLIFIVKIADAINKAKKYIKADIIIKHRIVGKIKED